MKNVKFLHPNDATDPAFGEALRQAAKAGVEISDLQIHIGYDLGMANVWKYAVNENVKHRSFFVGITSLF